MKRLFLLTPLLLLSACAHTRIVTNQPVIYPRDAWEGAVPADSVATIRQASRIHTYLVNDYIDPNNPRIRHQGHQIDVVEQAETWNLRPSGTMVANLGPVTAVSDPASAPNPYTAEFETQLVQQQNQSRQLAGMGQQMGTELAKLRELTAKGAAAASETESLQQQVDALQKKLDAQQPGLPTPPTPPAKKEPAWFDSIRGMFYPAPKDPPPAGTGAAQPAFRTSVALREAEKPFPAPGITILPGITIASASLPQEFYRMSVDDEDRLRIHSPIPVSSHFRPHNGDDLPPLPQP
jgi:hypothetical protein